MLELYDYIRSSAAYRVRITLALKNLDAKASEVHLLKDGGVQHTAEYKKINPQGLVPSLSIDGVTLTQSLAIIEFLEERYPDPPLLPKDPIHRAYVRAMTLAIAADIHPIQNLRVLNYLRKELAQPEEQVLAWARHWIVTGFEGFQALVERAPVKGAYCFGDTITLADVFLAPQMVNARRYGCDLSRVPRLVAIDAKLRELPAFAATTSEAATPPAR